MEKGRDERVRGGPRLGMTGSELVIRIGQSGFRPRLGITAVTQDNGKRFWVLDVHTTFHLLWRGSEMKGKYCFRSLYHS